MYLLTPAWVSPSDRTAASLPCRSFRLRARLRWVSCFCVCFTAPVYVRASGRLGPFRLPFSGSGVSHLAPPRSAGRVAASSSSPRSRARTRSRSHVRSRIEGPLRNRRATSPVTMRRPQCHRASSRACARLTANTTAARFVVANSWLSIGVVGQNVAPPSQRRGDIPRISIPSPVAPMKKSSCVASVSPSPCMPPLASSKPSNCCSSVGEARPRRSHGGGGCDDGGGRRRRTRHRQRRAPPRRPWLRFAPRFATAPAGARIARVRHARARRTKRAHGCVCPTPPFLLCHTTNTHAPRDEDVTST